MYYKKLENRIVRCQLCPKRCVIKDGGRGDCKARENRDGKLYSLVYGKSCSVSVDPLSKKPIFHMLPGTDSFSIGTAGCNLHCLFCQNWTTAQQPPENVVNYDLPPKDVVRKAIAKKCATIAYTYNEPIIFYEYVVDTAKIAIKKKIRNILVTNGYINKEPAQELAKYIDAANIDLKGFTEEYYRKVCFSELKPVLETIKIFKESGMWIEITNLIVPTLNDDFKKIREMCRWIKENIGADVPLHFSRFYPMYKLEHLEPTPEKTLLKAKEIAVDLGLKYVYIGNIRTREHENTQCPACGRLLVKRLGFSVLENNIKNGKCECGEKIAGVWS